MSDEFQDNMRGTIERCRRLAAWTHDQEIAQKLQALADEMEVRLRARSGSKQQAKLDMRYGQELTASPAFDQSFLVSASSASLSYSSTTLSRCCPASILLEAGRVRFGIRWSANCVKQALDD